MNYKISIIAGFNDIELLKSLCHRLNVEVTEYFPIDDVTPKEWPSDDVTPKEWPSIDVIRSRLQSFERLNLLWNDSFEKELQHAYLCKAWVPLIKLFRSFTGLELMDGKNFLNSLGIQ
jgi:hypothetical protein